MSMAYKPASRKISHMTAHDPGKSTAYEPAGRKQAENFAYDST